MATDLQEVRNQLIRYARRAVGQFLSTVPGPDNTQYPAIVKSIKDQPEAKPPFIVLDIGPRKRQARNVHRQQILDTGETEYENHFDYMCSYTVVGGDALKIASDLEAEFAVESSSWDLKKANVYLIDSEAVFEDQDEFNEKLINTAILNFKITVPDIIRRDEGCITSIALTGQVKEHENDDTPISIEVDV